MNSGEFRDFLTKWITLKSNWATSMQHRRCWWRTLETKYLVDKDVDDIFGHFGHQHPLSPNISVEHQHLKDVTNILLLSPKLCNCHQHHTVSNMTVAQIFVLEWNFTKKTYFKNHSKWYRYCLRTQEFFNRKSPFLLLLGQNRRWTSSGTYSAQFSEFLIKIFE